MARAQFDRNDVLDRAITLFGKHGFSASSMQQVVKATGLKPGSIYLAFGNKEGLFREALERYAKRALANIEMVLTAAPTVGSGICAILEQTIEATTEEGYSSCFLIKTQLELAAEGNELYKVASEKLSDIEKLFCLHLTKEYSPEESRRHAMSIMLHQFGLRVYGYQDDSVNRMKQGLRDGLPWLPWKAAATNWQ